MTQRGWRSRLCGLIRHPMVVRGQNVHGTYMACPCRGRAKWIEGPR